MVCVSAEEQQRAEDPRRRAEERVVSLNRIYAVLSNINTLIVRVHEREELFREACRVAVEFGHFGLAWVGMTSADNAHIKPIAWHGVGLWAESIGFAAATDVGNLDEALVDEAIQQQQTVVCRDLAQAAGMPVAAVERGREMTGLEQATWKVATLDDLSLTPRGDVIVNANAAASGGAAS